MKRIISILLVALVLCTVMVLTACGPGNTPTDPPETSGPSMEATLPSTDSTKPQDSTNPTDSTKPQDPTDGPTEPKPTDGPTEPKPTEPAPTEPKPTEPKPTEPKPTEPKPTEPTPTEPGPTEHKHKYTTKKVEPTCDEKGYTIYTCSCGHSYQADPVFVLGHNYSEWKNTVIPTSEREGVREKTCSRCGDKITDTLPKLPPEEHTHSYETKVVPPTCTSKGYTTYTCSCGHTREGDYVSVLDHDFTEWKVTVAATTSSTGLKERTCKSCGRRVELEIPKLEATGHTHSYTGTWKAPTCTEDGVTVFTCSCGDTYKGTDWQRPLGHDYTEWVVTKEPTTTACGDKQRSCKRCGLVEKDIVSPLDPSTGEKYESYIDPRIVYGDLMPGYYQYIEGNIIVQDRRSWGEAPSLYIESNGDLRVVYFQKDGTKITKTVTPKADQTQSVAIKNNGTFVVTDWHGFG